MTTSIPPTDALDVLLRFGVLMLQAGNTAVRTRKWIQAIGSAVPRYSFVLVAAAVGLASGGFAFLNGAAAPETIAAAIGGGSGQVLRS